MKFISFRLLCELNSRFFYEKSESIFIIKEEESREEGTLIIIYNTSSLQSLFRVLIFSLNGKIALIIFLLFLLISQIYLNENCNMLYEHFVAV
jgi:hypothetical protein